MLHSRLVPAVVFLAFASAIGPSSSHAESGAPVELQYSFTARIAEVTDGETYDVLPSTSETVPIRFHDVDVPESNQPFGGKSTGRARQLLRGENVRVSVDDVGR